MAELSDEEILKRAQQIQAGKDKAYRDERHQIYLAEQAKKEAEDREFAESTGITYEQYQEVYCRAQEQIYWEAR